MTLKTPIGFGQLSTGVYRSSYPTKKTFKFIENLKIKTLIALQPQDIKFELRDYCYTKNVEIIETDIGLNQEPFLIMSEPLINQIVNITKDQTKYPILIFCNNGKLRTSCVVGCIRKANNWYFFTISVT